MRLKMRLEELEQQIEKREELHAKTAEKEVEAQRKVNLYEAGLLKVLGMLNEHEMGHPKGLNLDTRRIRVNGFTRDQIIEEIVNIEKEAK